MDEVELFKGHVLKRAAMSPQELELFVSAFDVKFIKKKLFIAQPDFTAKYRSYIVRGAFVPLVIG